MTPPEDYEEEAQELFNAIDAERTSVGGMRIIVANLKSRDQRVRAAARAEAFEEAAKDVRCLSSQLPGNGACAFEDDVADGPCDLCVSAARLEGKAKAAQESR